MTRLAPFCPLLRFSILALSAFHLSHAEGSTDTEAEKFHEAAVSILLLLLRDRNVIADGAVLASTVILRLYEEAKGKSSTTITSKIS